MLTDEMELVSVDDHLIEHSMVWQDRLPSKYLELGPRIVETTERTTNFMGGSAEAGSEVWQYEGRIYHQIGLGATAGRPTEEINTDPVRFDQMRPGFYNSKARLEDMDLDGVKVQLCFPSFARFAGQTFLDGQDKKLSLLCVQAYNDFVLEEWCAAGPDRFIPMIILPLWDPGLAAMEMRRSYDKGARAVAFVENPAPLGLPSFHTDHWDPVFNVAEETGLVMCTHFGTSSKPPITAEDAPIAVRIALYGCNLMYATVDLLYSQVLHKHPQLKFALSEGGIGWIPYIVENADYIWERHWYHSKLNRDIRPSELFRKHFWGCFIEDEHGLAARHEIGVDRIMWEGDYPHSDGPWPNARQHVADMMKDVPDEEVQQIVEGNARKLFSFPRTA
jgi:predicted TIM-barrel fold metal-dependent hydrolase